MKKQQIRQQLWEMRATGEEIYAVLQMLRDGGSAVQDRTGVLAIACREFQALLDDVEQLSRDVVAVKPAAVIQLATARTA